VGRDFPLRRGTSSCPPVSHLPPYFYRQVVEVVVPVGWWCQSTSMLPRREIRQCLNVWLHGHLPRRGLGEDHVWFDDRWMVASLCDE
jgi:hypothetical protein